MGAQSKRTDLSGNMFFNGALLVAGAEGGGGMVCVLEGEEENGEASACIDPGNLL